MALLGLLSTPTFANLEGLNQLATIERETKAREQAEKEAKARQEAAQKAAQQREANRRYANQQAANKAKAEADNKRRAEAKAEADADKSRDQHYEDQLRDMQMEAIRIELDKKKARAARENDVIDAELKAAGAMTDVIQSEADAKRTKADAQKVDAEGRKSYLNQKGSAELKQSEVLVEDKKGWFN
ncbi:MAG: DUF5384 family protein [Bacteroidales bacterium]